MEVMHWEKFKARANSAAYMVPSDSLPVPLPDFRERVGRSFPGMRLRWPTLDSPRPVHGVRGFESYHAIGIVVLHLLRSADAT